MMTIGDVLKDKEARNTMTTLEIFYGCCRFVIDECRNPYAVAYAKAGLSLGTSNEVRVQCLYILNNIQNWRGGHSKDVRQLFKMLNKKLEKERHG